MSAKVMPHSSEAEMAILGSMFMSKAALELAASELNKDLFYEEKHALIFDVLKDLYEKKSLVDITTVITELNRRHELSQVGGAEYLTDVAVSVATGANVEEYIKIVEEKAILRRLITSATDIVTDGYNEDGELSEILDNAEKKILNVVKTRKGSEFRTISDVMSKTENDLEQLSHRKSEITGLATGFYDLDKVTAGFHPNELIIIAARPAMGKTTFALNLATNIAINSNKAVALFNMEMGAEQLAVRMISSLGQIELNKLLTGRLEHDDWKKVNEAISRISPTNLYMDDTPGMTISEIRAKCRRLASTTDLGIIIIDYLQLINGSAKYLGNRQQEVSEISRSLKTLAMELNVPIVALAQLSRTVEGREDKRPILSDLRESGSIEQDADIVAFLYRDDYYTKEISIDEYTSKSEFIIAKHRSGPTATINLVFRRNKSTFLSMINVEES